jgi:hypothetical protein
VQIYAPAADPSILMATAATLGLTVQWLEQDTDAEPGRALLLLFQPLDLRLADGSLPASTVELCQGYQHLCDRADDPAAFGGQRRLVVNLSTCSIPALLREAQTCGESLSSHAKGFARPGMDPLAALLALQLEKRCPGTLAACERLEQLAGREPQDHSYRQQLEQACDSDQLLAAWCRRQDQERQLQDQGHELDSRLMELGSLPLTHEQLLRKLENQDQALSRCMEITSQRDHWMEHCRELEATLDSLQRQLEHESKLRRQQAELTQRWAEASRGLQRIPPLWLKG